MGGIKSDPYAFLDSIPLHNWGISHTLQERVNFFKIVLKALQTSRITLLDLGKIPLDSWTYGCPGLDVLVGLCHSCPLHDTADRYNSDVCSLVRIRNYPANCTVPLEDLVQRITEFITAAEKLP